MTLDVSVGDKFGQLTVLEIVSRGKGLARGVRCRCDCGTEYSSDVRRIYQGFTSRCHLCASKKLEIGEAKLRQSERQYRNNARNKGYSFDLSTKQFRGFIQSPCGYCGLVPARGIDRQDNQIGYVPDNCIACCVDCNRAKSNMSAERFTAWITRLATHQGFSL